MPIVGTIIHDHEVGMTKVQNLTERKLSSPQINIAPETLFTILVVQDFGCKIASDCFDVSCECKVVSEVSHESVDDIDGNIGSVDSADDKMEDNVSLPSGSGVSSL